MDGDEINIAYLQARLDPQVVFIIDVPCAGMAYHVAIARLHEQRSLPECLRKRREAHRDEEILAVLHHAFWDQDSWLSAAPSRLRRCFQEGRATGRYFPTPAPRDCLANERGSDRPEEPAAARTSASVCSGHRHAAKDKAAGPAAIAAPDQR